MSNKSAWLDDLVECLRFFTRLPVRARKAGVADFATAWRAAPLAGAVIGGLGGITLIILLWLGMAPALASGFALAVLVISTGALHEDGLADIADGFGGGWNRDRKLEIMRDSRVGTFGVAAVVLSILLRWAAILAFATGIGVLAAAILVGSGAVSRWLAIAVPRRLPPARPDGLAATTGAISDRAFRQASATALVLALAVTGPVAGFGWTLLALLAAGAALFVICGLARWQIAGYTGDVIGAAQQVTEIVFLAVLTLSLST